MRKTITKFVVALLAFTTILSGVGVVYAAEARSPYPETETVTKTDTSTSQGCSLKLTATATVYLLDHVEAGSYSTTPYYPGCTYSLVSSGWTSKSGKSITCSAKGLFIPNSSSTGFYLNPSITFAI